MTSLKTVPMQSARMPAYLSSSARWYVVQTKPKQEFRALEQLQNQHYECFLPTILVQKVLKGRICVVSEPLFSRYLFIRLDTDTSNWSPIRSTRGVSGLVAFGSRYATLPDHYIEAMQERAQIDPSPCFTVGEPVRVTDGPFAGLDGIYHLPDGEARALVLIDLMRQPQKLSIPVASLSKVS